MTLPHSPEKPLPTPEQYEHAARKVDALIDESVWDMERFWFNRLGFISHGGTKSETRLLVRVNQFGKRIQSLEPSNESKATSGTLTKERIVSYGAAAGLAIVGRLHGKVLYTKDIIHHTSLAGTDIADKDLVTLIARSGEAGLTLMGRGATTLIDQWQERLTDDTEKGVLFKHMIGLVAVGAWNAHNLDNIEAANRYETARFADEVEKIDLDSEEFHRQIMTLLEDGHSSS
jgi:hypothetical protein